MTRLRRAALLCRGRLTSRSCCLVSARPCVSLLRGDVSSRCLVGSFQSGPVCCQPPSVISLYCRSETAARVLFPGRKHTSAGCEEPCWTLGAVHQQPVCSCLISSFLLHLYRFNKLKVFHTELQQQFLSSGAASARGLHARLRPACPQIITWFLNHHSQSIPLLCSHTELTISFFL